jgi:hypothetical protein
MLDLINVLDVELLSELSEHCSLYLQQNYRLEEKGIEKEVEGNKSIYKNE